MMNESTKTIIAENIILLSKTYHFSLTQIIELQKIAKSLHHLNENACNYGLTQRQETRHNNLIVKAKNIAKADNYDGRSRYPTILEQPTIVEQNDPRGWPLMIAYGPIKDEQHSSYDRICPL